MKLVNDVALAVAEEAFRAGYEAAIVDAEQNLSADWYYAWCEFLPSEDIRALAD